MFLGFEVSFLGFQVFFLVLICFWGVERAVVDTTGLGCRRKEENTTGLLN